MATNRLLYGLITFLLFSSVCLAWSSTKQYVKVQGEVFCPQNPKAAYGITVKLIDEDTGPNPDDKMAENKTDSMGRFYMQGYEREFTHIDPRIKIYHDCNDRGRICKRKWKIGVPNRYINQDMIFDMGRLNLEMIMDEEERDCFQ